jgi:hypothetical protein
MWHYVCTDPVLRCFDDLEGLSCRDVLVGVVSKLLSWLTV